MEFNKQITDKITLIGGELNNWKYEENAQIPLIYKLWFKFYSEEYAAYFSHKRLQADDYEPVAIFGDSDLFSSFEDIFRDDDNELLFQEIKKACEQIWEAERDDNA